MVLPAHPLFDAGWDQSPFPLTRSLLQVSSASPASVPPLPCSAYEVIPEFLTLTPLGQNFPLDVFRVRSVGPEQLTSFIKVMSDESLPEGPCFLNLFFKSGATFAESDPCSFYGLCPDVHSPFLPLLILLNLITCWLGNILNTSLKTKNKSIVHRRNGGKMSIGKHRVESIERWS